MTLARIITIFFFVSPSLALAQGAPKIVTLQKNQRAPFAGSLLNPAAVAKTIAEKENSAAHHWWALGGFVTGIATSVAIFYAAVEISR